MKNLSIISIFLSLSFYMVLLYNYLHYVDIFECVFGKFELDFSNYLDEKYGELFKFLIIFVLEIVKVYFCEFMIDVFSISFVDPIIHQRIRIWTIATFLSFFYACSTFVVWIFGMCKTVFQKIKTKVQGLFGLF